MESTFHLPHSHKEWPIVKHKLQLLSDKAIDGSLEAMGTVVAVSPYWGIPDKPPLLDSLNKALSQGGGHYTKETFCEEILPYMAGRALEVEDLFPDKTIKLLFSGIGGEVTITRHQASCILALAAFCLLDKPKVHGARYQRLSLIEIFEYGFFKSQSSKCLCIVGYFDRLRKEELAGNRDYLKRCITIKRKMVEEQSVNIAFWKDCDRQLTPFNVYEDRFIESFHGCLQVDFANEYIGGGVLQQGNVQEEIRFVINPECLVSMLYCEAMNPRESILIMGAETFSTYTGYGGGFTYTGPYTDPNPVDASNRCSIDIIAIDAIPAAWLPGGAVYQFKPESILREICKAYCGFSSQACGDDLGNHVPVATGNWGCGAFGGKKELKTIVQWIAASVACREVHYCTFGDRSFAEQLKEFVKLAIDSKVSVGKLTQLIMDPKHSEQALSNGTYSYIEKCLSE